MSKIQYLNDKTSSLQEAHGSDKRLNVSARSNPRGFYVSRDTGQSYTVTSIDASAAAGTYIIYFQNTSSTLSFFVDKIIVGGVETALWKLWFVTGTAAGGSPLTPTNLNKRSSHAAAATSRGDDSITGLTTDGLILAIRTGANGHDDQRIDDIILGQNHAIAIEYNTGTTGIAEATIRGFFE